MLNKVFEDLLTYYLTLHKIKIQSTKLGKLNLVDDTFYAGVWMQFLDFQYKAIEGHKYRWQDWKYINDVLAYFVWGKNPKVFKKYGDDIVINWPMIEKRKDKLGETKVVDAMKVYAFFLSRLPGFSKLFQKSVVNHQRQVNKEKSTLKSGDGKDMWKTSLAQAKAKPVLGI